MRVCLLPCTWWVRSEIRLMSQVNLWGLDAIKTKGESVAVALYMVGARPVREGTGRIARCAGLFKG